MRVHVPNLREYGDPNVLVGLAREAEQAGWDGFFVWDHILHRRTPSRSRSSIRG